MHKCWERYVVFHGSSSKLALFLLQKAELGYSPQPLYTFLFLYSMYVRFFFFFNEHEDVPFNISCILIYLLSVYDHVLSRVGI